MLRMISVTETSEIGFSDAVKKAVHCLIDKGEKVHFFVLQEHRGTVKNGILEYQVIVQISVE
jgi:flavin-binding protein dodecin